MEKIQVVLASPSDLGEERKMIKALIDSLNPLYMKYDICIDLRMWENVVPGMNADGPQGVIDIDLEIATADVFICLYWKRIGTLLPNENVAGTEHELNLALDSYHKRRKPDIKAFFKSYDSEDNDDIKKIKEIARRLQPLGLYTPFKDISILKDTINKILQAEVMKKIQNRGAVTPVIHEYVEVSDTKGFVENLASNTKLVMSKGFYNILDFDGAKANVFKESVFDGEQLVVTDVSDITIVGDNSTLLIEPRYATVLTFRNCSNIKIIGLTLGHVPQKGSCAGAVLRFEGCDNIQLDTLELFGCGTYGIELFDCTNIRTNGVKIFECTYGGLNINNSNLEFVNSMIYDCNKTAGCIIEARSSQLNFRNVSIFHNYIDNYLISLEESSLFCEGVCIYSNSFSALCNETISWGIFLEDNNIIDETGDYVTICSTQKMDKERYNDYKLLAMNYGKLEECIYEDGTFSISLTCSSYIKGQQLAAYIEQKDNVILAYG